MDIMRLFFQKIACLSSCLLITYLAFSQNTSLSTLNSGGGVHVNLIYSVGDVFVEPTGFNQSGNGFISILAELGTTSISENLTFDEISVFPNPSNASFFIQTSDNQPKMVWVLNSLGTIVKREKIANGQALDLSEFPNDIYWLVVADDKYRFHNVLKIIKIK